MVSTKVSPETNGLLTVVSLLGSGSWAPPNPEAQGKVKDWILSALNVSGANLFPLTIILISFVICSMDSVTLILLKDMVSTMKLWHDPDRTDTKV